MVEETVETFAYGAQRYRIENGKVIVIYGSGDMSREALIAWANLVIDTINQEPPGSKVYLMADLTNPRQGFTPYTRIVVEDIYKRLPPDRDIVAAIVMRDSILIQIITALVNRLQ